ncbi:MAG: 5'-nucleotidase [Dethiosulfatibacter sp.]|nr:5'-nucleotidase [Dethiosulfatibacter sp.]
MAYDLSNKLVVAISSRALFDLEEENNIFNDQGVEEYAKHQLEHENEQLSRGTAFPLVKALLSLNDKFEEPIVEVIIMSRNTPETGLRVFNSIDSHGINIVRAAFTGGEDISRYIGAFEVDLFLSKNDMDVQEAIDNGFAAAIIYDVPIDYKPDETQIRIAFDADAVVFSEESEKIYQADGLEAFLKHEKDNVDNDLLEGPFAKLLKTLSKIKEKDENLIRIAIVTARNNPAHKRVIYTLRHWGVKVDEAFFLGGVKKREVLKAFNAHIFFDDQDGHVKPASEVIPASRVPLKQK